MTSCCSQRVYVVSWVLLNIMIMFGQAVSLQQFLKMGALSECISGGQGYCSQNFSCLSYEICHHSGKLGSYSSSAHWGR